jgi:hypothetical protein
LLRYVKRGDRVLTHGFLIFLVKFGILVLDDLPHADQEAVRHRAVAALNLTQQAKQIALGGAGGDDQSSANTALIDGVRKFAMDVRELDIDPIDRINPFGEAYAILANYERGKPETGGGGDFCQARHPHAALAFSLSAAQSCARP